MNAENRKPVRAYISFGSNINRRHNILSAYRLLIKRFPGMRVSPVYETQAIGFSGDAFYNLVAVIETGESAADIAAFLRRLEDEHGRQRQQGKFSSRTLDLDLLTYGNRVIDDGDLKLPRDEITRYAFVLKPLADLAPDDRHPVLNKTYAELWQSSNMSDQSLWKISLNLEDL